MKEEIKNLFGRHYTPAYLEHLAKKDPSSVDLVELTYAAFATGYVARNAGDSGPEGTVRPTKETTDLCGKCTTNPDKTGDMGACWDKAGFCSVSIGILRSAIDDACEGWDGYVGSTIEQTEVSGKGGVFAVTLDHSDLGKATFSAQVEGQVCRIDPARDPWTVADKEEDGRAWLPLRRGSLFLALTQI